MAGQDDLPSLEVLEQQIRAASPQSPKADAGAGKARGLALGMRLTTELLAGTLVGAGLGWFLDDWLGTKPVLMIVLFFLGFAAGVFNVIKAVEALDMEENSGTTTPANDSKN